MTDVQAPTEELTSSGVERQIGGEAAHRGFFGGTQPKTRMIGLGVAFVGMLILTPTIGVWGLVISVAVGVAVTLATLRTHRGSLLERRERRRCWPLFRARGQRQRTRRVQQGTRSRRVVLVAGRALGPFG